VKYLGVLEKCLQTKVSQPTSVRSSHPSKKGLAGSRHSEVQTAKAA